MTESDGAIHEVPSGAEGSSNPPPQASTRNQSHPSSPHKNTTDDECAHPNLATVNSPGGSTAQRPPEPIKATPRYLALCVNTGSMYKTLVEFDVSEKTSDADVFYMLKDAYVNLRGLRTLYGFLMKPVDVHFVHVGFQSNLWANHLQNYLVSLVAPSRRLCLYPR